MVTIDLTAPAPEPASFLDGLPRRLALTLPELRLAAAHAGEAPLPFDLEEPPEPGALEGRLGHSRGSAEAEAYAEALDTLHDPEESLRRRGLLTDGGMDASIVGAIGLLATPTLALDLDVTADGTQVKAWHRQGGDAVATLATCDGIVFELAWFHVDQWPAELARTGAVPADVTLRASAVPESIDLPLPLLDAVGEALRAGRSDLVPVLAQQHGQGVVDGSGRPVPDGEVGAVAQAFHTEGRGRLRVLGARVDESETTQIGVVSWVLLADGWHSLAPHTTDQGPRVRVRRVQPADLATDLAPVLAQVNA
ncbi:hypothetical protein DDE18_12840 [Nocardioides gansuensis]|uniref:ESX secretion-associated protein EspG n=1 Tax=Nocardioides gansuensis TaxID=2138300 RepID=A0A2T8F9E9_9ACTN|nr:hypothetical protein [Nocardioides gansuensis]PVG82361.1 hypothetical protein DDE18_12840 [Nocardioides gansuensis]